MFKRRKKEKKSLSYVALHNAAVVRFQKSSRIFIWAAIVNFVGLIIGHIQFLSGTTEIPFSFCYGVSTFILDILWYNVSLDTYAIIIIAYVISFALSGVTAWMGVMSSQANKKFLFACVIFYFFDWIFVLLAFFIAGEPWSGLLINGGIHAIITFFLVMAVYQYYNVIKIEKRFVKPANKPETVINEEDISDARS